MNIYRNGRIAPFFVFHPIIAGDIQTMLRLGLRRGATATLSNQLPISRLLLAKDASRLLRPDLSIFKLTRL